MSRRALRFVAVASVACARPVVVSTSTGGAAPVATPAPTVGASAAADYGSIERNLVAELNAARTNPAAYAAHLTAMLPLYDGRLLRRGSGPAIQTQEGAAAVREAIDALRAQAPVPALTLSSAMSLAAHDLANDQRRTGGIGHTGSDGSSPDSRLSRYGAWQSRYNENVDYGPFTSARDVVIDLLVDDGVRDRGHRRNIFDASSRVAGTGCTQHPRYTSVCVIDQAAGFTPR